MKGSVNMDDGFDLGFSDSECFDAEEVKPSEIWRQKLEVGQKVEVYSNTADSWVPARVTSLARASGHVTVHFRLKKFGRRLLCRKHERSEFKLVRLPQVYEGSSSEEEEEHDPCATGVIQSLRAYTDMSSIWNAIDTGDVVLIKGSWLLRQYHNKAILPCRQELPPNAIWDPSVLKQRSKSWGLLSHGSVHIIAISHCWLTREHPDPEGSKLQDLGAAIEALEYPYDSEWTAFFLDWCSLFQKRKRLFSRRCIWEREPDEEKSFRRALDTMHMWYAHALIHTWVLNRAPPGKPQYGDRGWTTWEHTISTLISGTIELDVWVLDLSMINSDCGRIHDHILDYEDLKRECSSNRLPPLVPTAFNEKIENKQFTSGYGDLEMIKEQYALVFHNVMGSAKELTYVRLGWGDDEVQRLVQVLPHCHNLEFLGLQGNEIGDAGAEALAYALSSPKTCPRLERLVVAGNRITDAGLQMLRQVLGWNPVCG
eukprot:gnl/TRDRNA2_/TRDRNA2_151258_c0_seq2.p1 gnl/TRDRNA2_/TRDRNA2_151258_c0~~gnl/TRDRNA2_/TRDRNA2_151258_c0_seq2.p1  ORF type:complete len:483 (+),score=74.12 gnl/TRDRNA2_/TRDRNA2_151258_c0_seq2:112-1560(+)